MKNQLLSESNHSTGVFTRALENVATLRVDNGESMSRITFASDNIAATKTNMKSANGQMIDLDIASECTRLAKVQRNGSGICGHARTCQHNEQSRPDLNPMTVTKLITPFIHPIEKK